MTDNLESRLSNIEKMLLSQKNVLSFSEAVQFMGISESYLYKLTMAKSVPHYKPLGKMIYFDRAELEKFLLRNRVFSQDEIEVKASTYVALNDRRIKL